MILRRACFVAAAGLLSACMADGRYEGVTTGAGNAIAANTVMQMVDPWPPGVQDTELEVPAERPASQAAGEDAGSDDSGASDDD